MDAFIPSNHAVSFLLGANTPSGFVSRFDQLLKRERPFRLFVIKGGPGTGKSTFMKRIADELAHVSRDMEYIYCSSDIDSLDGIIFNDLKIALADGSPPHVIEPRYPGAFESVVYLGDCWDEERLQASREAIIGLYSKISASHEHCCRFLAAAAALSADTYGIALEHTDKHKIKRYAARVTATELRRGTKAAPKEQIRFLSAITNKGHVIFANTVKALCPKVFVIMDEYGAASRLLMNELRERALASGHDVISCCCPLSPFDKIDHVLIPDAGIAFVSSSKLFPIHESLNAYRTIHAKRFSDMELIGLRKKRIQFNRKAAAQMLEQAAALLAQAKALHDELEGYYKDAMDFEKVNIKQEQVLKKIRAIL